MKKKYISRHFFPLYLLFLGCFFCQCSRAVSDIGQELEAGFKNPPVSAKSGVYWYFMDGNLSKEGITKDLEAMVRVGISHAIFLEVNVGVPRGKVDMLSPEWKDIFRHMVGECERLGVQLTLAGGPGWAGSGGPWVKSDQTMKHLVARTIQVEGSGTQKITLPKPDPRRPYFSPQFTPQQQEQWTGYYEDVAVLAFPTPEGSERLADNDEKALYYRAPYSSEYDVKQFLPMAASYPDAAGSTVDPNTMVDLTSRLKPDGTLDWEVPAGKWTVMRFGSRNSGGTTRPAPAPGEGFEADKMDTLAMAHHLESFMGQLFRDIGFRGRTSESPSGGLTMLHIDSWEMGAQNWTGRFREEFQVRRGYDPQPYYPAYLGLIVGNRELSERFLWDMRKTVQELIAQNHSGYLREYAHRLGLGLSIEPYDMTPIADMELGATGDVTMCEFWSVGYGFNTTFSPTEATSIAHIKGQPVVPAESFTAMDDGWAQYPGRMKDQTDWALAAGINRFMFHTFQHQNLPDSLKPGMTMGSIGVHWDRSQTWWEMGKAYHDYLSRSQFLLQQGRTVADILYLCPEGNPHVFRAPASAYEINPETPDKAAYSSPQGLQWVNTTEYVGTGLQPDKRGYSFDGCPPSLLYSTSVKNGRVVFPSGAEYRILVLPYFETMTPEMLNKIKALVTEGATVVGMPPKKSPSLENYPACDQEITRLVTELWGASPVPQVATERQVGKGRIIWGEDMLKSLDYLYPHYDYTARILKKMGVAEDFAADGNIRYTHRTLDGVDIYFVSNRSGKPITAECTFRIEGMAPELWDAVTGDIRNLEYYTSKDGQTTVPMQFDTDQSFFVVFRRPGHSSEHGKNFKAFEPIGLLDNSWTVSFDPRWGGPGTVTFDKLIDWSNSSNEGIKYYSGTAVYEQTFETGDLAGKDLFLDLGEVNVMAKVWLNGQEAGTVWTYPWRVNVSDQIRPGSNDLKIEVVNLWINRMIGDDYLPYDGVLHGQWPDWLTNGTPHTRTRYTFSTYNPYNRNTPLAKSGLVGPVRLIEAR